MKSFILMLGLFVTSLLLAETYEQSYLNSYTLNASINPVPTHVVSPVISGVIEDTRVTLEFTVNEKGVVEGVKAPDNTPTDLAKVICKAISKWEFSPAVRDGKPTAVKVSLPVVLKSE